MNKFTFATVSAVAVLALAGCARQPSAPVGMHDMPDGTKMMDHDMPGMHQMPDGSMMADSDASSGMDMGDMPCCKKGPNGMECPMMKDMGSMKGMGSMDHDDMTMGDMVDMLKGKTGDDLDAAFLEGMIPHHQGAVDMAKLILENAKHEELRAMARDIIDAQQREIDMMKDWQRQWGYAK